MKKMKSKIFGMIALMAFAFSLVFAGVERVNMDDFIWVYVQGGDATDNPNCEPSDDFCAALHYFDGTKDDNVGEPVLDENEEQIMLKGDRIL